MSKFLILSLLFICAIVSGQTQTITLKVRHRPNTTLRQLMEQETQTTVSYSGSEDFLDILKSRGQENPQTTKTSMAIESLVSTGKLNGNQFPIAMTFTKLSGNAPDIPVGTKILGHVELESMPVFDSVVSEKLSADYKRGLLDGLSSIFSQFNLPEKAIKIGESITVETPFSYPLPNGMKLNMDIVSVYKFVSMKGNIAELDITMEYVAKNDFGIEELNSKMTGTGKGTIKYDVTATQFIDYVVETDMKMEMHMESIKIEMNSKSLTSQKILN